MTAQTIAQGIGHRFLSAGDVTIPSADAYPRTLAEEGKVIASFLARRELVRQRLSQQFRLGKTMAETVGKRLCGHAYSAEDPL